MTTDRGHWGSRFGFVLAAAGSAVGLGNIWKFPYITGENGGGLFVLIYLVCIVLVGVPIMMAEIMIGRAAQKQPVAAFHALGGGRSSWSVVGWMGIVTGFLILSFYIVVAGWSMDFTLKSIANFTSPIHETADAEGLRYRATTTIDDMRTMLVERRAERTVKDPRAQVLRRVAPSVHEDFARYEAALAAAIERGTDEATARGRLLRRPELAGAVDAVSALEPDLRAAAASARTEAMAHYDARTDEQVAVEAEDVTRRTAIAAGVGAAFGATISNGWMSALWMVIFLAITMAIVAGGVTRGIERTCRFLMPTLIGLIVVMVIYGLTQPGAGEALAFVFKPDASKLEPSGVLEALGHAFFTLSLGMGAMITYGSYMQSKTGIASTTFMIAGLDTLIALLACLMIFPIVFSYGQDASAGPGLVFISMPLAFSEIGSGGMLLAIIFFGLLFFAALTSAISLLEVVASYFIDAHGWSRRRATLVVGTAVLVVGLIVAFDGDRNFLMPGWSASYGIGFFDTLDYLTSNWMLPLGGLLIALYAGWVLPKRFRDAEVADLGPGLVLGWLVLVRFVAPALVVVVLLQKVGLLDANQLFHSLLH